MGFVLHRIYDRPAPDGYHVLVDRLWPRGVSKADADLDEWLRDVAPSTELRKWYGHEVDRYPEFKRRYGDELEQPPALAAFEHLETRGRSGTVVLLTATKDVAHSGADVLLDHLSRSTGS